MSTPLSIPMAQQPSSSPTNSKAEGPFKRLVRSLSRSGRTGGSPKAEYPPRSSSRGKGAPPSPSAGMGLSTSPPPDSYFPKPPRSTLLDGEANGRERHPESLGARAADLSLPTAQGQSAPGVSFAPQAPSDQEAARRTKEELEGWEPKPRRSNSQRVTRRPSENGGAEGAAAGAGVGVKRGGLSRTRAASASNTANGNGNASGNGETEEGSVEGASVKEVRRGVTLEDKPLSRTTSVKRAASALRRATTNLLAYDPVQKEQGEVRAMLLMADGSEEIELVTVLDVLVRAGVQVTVCSLSPGFSPSQSLPYITLSRGAKMMADTQFETLKQEHKDDFDAVIIPGGAKGAERLSQSATVQALIRDFHSQGKLVAMICAGSLAAKTSGIALGERLTSHPSVKGELEKHYRYSEDRVVVSGNLVTSRGPGTALEWSLRIVEILVGKAKREEVEGPMMI